MVHWRLLTRLLHSPVVVWSWFCDIKITIPPPTSQCTVGARSPSVAETGLSRSRAPRTPFTLNGQYTKTKDEAAESRDAHTHTRPVCAVCSVGRHSAKVENSEGGKKCRFFHRHLDHVDDQVGAPGRPAPHTCIARSHLSHHRDGSETYPLCVLTRSLPDVRPAQECPWSTYRPL